MPRKPFAEGLVLPASVTGEAPFQLPHGTAPSSPVNGDIWTTTAGLYVRVNGVTVGPLGTGGGGGGATISDTAPGSPTAGQLWFESDTGLTYVYYDSTWVEIGNSGLEAFYVSDTAPTIVANGMAWFKSDSAQTFIYYDSAWVEVGPGAAIGALDASVVHLAGTETITGLKTFTQGSLPVSKAHANTTQVGVTNTSAANGADAKFIAQADTGYVLLRAIGSTTSYVALGNYTPAAGDVDLVSSRPMMIGPESNDPLRFMTNGFQRLAIAASGELTLGASSYLVAPAATTSIPSIRLPHGTAPSSPTNGDVWTTTAGVYARINGATVGPLSAGGGVTFPLDIPATSDPTAGTDLKLYAKDIAGRKMLKGMGPSGVDYPFQPALFGNRIQMFFPQTGTTGTGGTVGTAWTANGTVSHPTPSATAPASTNQMKRTRYANVVTTTNQQLGPRFNSASERMFWRGNAAGLGGFFFYTRFIVELYPASTVRLFAGLAGTNSTAVCVSDTVINDVCGLWHDTTDPSSGANSLNFVTRNTATTTKQSIALSNALAAGNAYDFTMFCAPNGTEIFWRLVDLRNGVTYSGSQTATLPTNNVFMQPQVQMSNGTANVTVTTTAIGICSIYVESDF